MALPVAARGGHVQVLSVQGRDRVAVLLEWAPGAKPAPGRDTYVLGDLRVVAWKLGVAGSSRGAPLLGASDLPAVVDGWAAREAGG